MIKTSAQLRNAQERLNIIQKLLGENGQKYSGLELEVHNMGLIIEENDLYEQIIEYRKLRELPFTDAIDFLSKKPVLIDNIGEFLAKLRIAAKLSQSEMAKHLGWEQSNLSRFESENYSSQTINKIVEYASMLGVWLHVRPSLTEEVEVAKKRPEIRTFKSDVVDTVSTSINNPDETSDLLQAKSYSISSVQQDVASI